MCGRFLLPPNNGLSLHFLVRLMAPNQMLAAGQPDTYLIPCDGQSVL